MSGAAPLVRSRPAVALAYSGGLDTSVAARWLAEEHGLHVVAVTVDVGQELDRDVLQARAEAAGAELVVVDAREEYVTEFCWPALQANALYEGKYPLVSSLARPLIAAKVIETARAAGAGIVAHGCTGKGNDQVRFETTFAALGPELQVMAPVRESVMSRDEARARAEEWGIPLAAVAKVFSVDENLWGRTVECGPLEDPWAAPPDDAFLLTADPSAAPDQPEEIVVGFERGLPVSLEGRRLDPVTLVAELTEVAGRHGFGRVDMIENRLVGIKSRELYEVPGAMALIAAHRDLEDLTLERDLAHEKAGAERRWAELAYYGMWHSPLHASLRAFVASTQANVTGDVRLRFFKGSCSVVGRRSPVALYDLSLATYEAAGDRFDHRHAEGFIRLWSLPVRTWSARQGPGSEAEPELSASIQDESEFGSSTQGKSGLGPPTKGEALPAAHEGPAASRAEEAMTGSAAPGANAAPVAAPGHGSEAPEGVATPGHGSEAPHPAGVRHTWSGRLAGGLSDEAFRFTRSLEFDRRLAPYDIKATAAHVESLAEAGVLSVEDRAALLDGLDEMAREVTAGTFPWADGDEDVHSAIERVLTERLGPAGARVHAGRSRNDLVVTDLRLWTKDACDEVMTGIGRLGTALADQAETNLGVVMPGYTHLQRGQPVSLSHHLLAHAFPLARDARRFLRARQAADCCALGAGALAGSTLALPTDTTAERLGFSRSFANSIDAVSDRDFGLEFLSACTILGIHLSRLAEDVVLWASAEFGFVRLPDRHSTGSSMMPQKRNPDVAELARGKAGRLLGDLVALATAMKGLPLAYDRDLQEDKEPLFDAFDTLAAALPALSALVADLTFDAGRMRAAVDPSAMATDLAETLVARGVPFREAHETVGALVARLESEHRTLAELGPGEWAAVSPLLGPETASLFDVDEAVERRTTPGGPSSGSVKEQLVEIRGRLAELAAPSPPAAASGFDSTRS
jgi:argininosuccinate lyase/argininosuccinate synthase